MYGSLAVITTAKLGCTSDENMNFSKFSQNNSFLWLHVTVSLYVTEYKNFINFKTFQSKN